MTDFKNCNFLIGINFGLSSSIFRFYKKKQIVETEIVTFNFGLLYLIEHIYNHKGLVMLTPMSILLILFLPHKLTICCRWMSWCRPSIPWRTPSFTSSSCPRSDVASKRRSPRAWRTTWHHRRVQQESITTQKVQPADDLFRGVLDERLAGIRQESSECKEWKRKQQISPPKKFYLAEQLLKRKVLPNNYMWE